MNTPKTKFYITINSRLRHNQAISPKAKLVCIELLGMIEGSAGVVFDSDLSQLLNISLPDVAEALNELRDQGMIVYELDINGARHITISKEVY